MKYLSILALSLLLCTTSNAQTKKGIEQLGENDVALLTQDYHDTWVDWSGNDRYIVFISPKSGSNNVYRIDLNNIEFIEVRPELYAANYLIDSLASNPVEQITFESQRIVESPIYIPNTNKVAYRTYDCELPSGGCGDFDVRVYDFDTKETTTIIKTEFHIYDIIDQNRMFFVPAEDESLLVEWDMNTGEESIFKQFDFNIRGLQVHGETVLIDEGNKIHELNLSSKETKLVYEGTIFGTRMEIINGMLITTLSGPIAGLLDLSVKEPIPFFNKVDYQPSVSNNHKYVVAISEGMGGILLTRFE